MKTRFHFYALLIIGVPIIVAPGISYSMQKIALHEEDIVLETKADAMRLVLAKALALKSVMIQRAVQADATVGTEAHPLVLPVESLTYDRMKYIETLLNMSLLDGGRGLLRIKAECFHNKQLEELALYVLLLWQLDIEPLSEIAQQVFAHKVKSEVQKDTGFPDDKYKNWMHRIQKYNFPDALKASLVRYLLNDKDRNQMRSWCYFDVGAQGSKKFSHMLWGSSENLVTWDVHDGVCLIWNMPTGDVAHEIEFSGIKEMVFCKAPFMAVLYTSTSQEHDLIGLLNLLTLSVDRFYCESTHKQFFRGLVSNQDGSMLATGVGTDIVLWNIDKGSRKLLKATVENKGASDHLLFLPGGKYLVQIGSNGNIYFWDIMLGSCFSADQHKKAVVLAQVTAQGNLVTLGEDGLLCTWDSKNGQLKSSISCKGTAIGFNTGCSKIILAQEDGITSFDIETGAYQPLAGAMPGEQFVASCYNKANTLIALATAQNKVYLLNAQGALQTVLEFGANSTDTVQNIKTPLVGEASNAPLSFDAQGNFLVCRQHNKLRLWYYPDEEIRDFIEHKILFRQALWYVCWEKDIRADELKQKLISTILVWMGKNNVNDSEERSAEKY